MKPFTGMQAARRVSQHTALVLVCAHCAAALTWGQGVDANAATALPPCNLSLVPDRGCSMEPLMMVHPDRYLRAEALMKAGKNIEALRAVNEALKRSPNDGAAYALRSGILANLDQLDQAIKDAESGITLSKSPRDKAVAAYNKCFSLTQLDRKAEALKTCSQSIRFDPTYGTAHFGAGKLYYYLQMWSEAATALDRTIELNPKLAAAWAYRAEVYFQSDQLQNGMAAAAKAVELAPGDPRSFRARAIGYQLSKQFDAMLTDATRAVELDPSRPLGHLLRGKALEFLGRHDEALAEYAAEQYRTSQEPQQNPLRLEIDGSRINNCGNESTTFQLPGGPPTSELEECFKRVRDNLRESGTPQPAPQKRTLPGLPQRSPKP